MTASVIIKGAALTGLSILNLNKSFIFHVAKFTLQSLTTKWQLYLQIDSKYCNDWQSKN